jgi:hypothetical protein
MNGHDMHRVVGRRMAVKPLRDSLAALHRRPQATPPATAGELLRLRRAEAAMQPEPRPRPVLR